MKPISKFTVEEHGEKDEDRALRSSLYYDGEDIQLKVPGFVIDRQFELHHYFLLLMSWDCPFEEGCEVVVLNKNLKKVGSYSFVPFYNSYLLSNIKEIAHDHYEVIFYEADCYDLKINYPKKGLFSKVVTVTKRGQTESA